MGKQPGKGGGKRRPGGPGGAKSGGARGGGGGRSGGGGENRDTDALKQHRGLLMAACQELVVAADAGATHLSEHEQRIVAQMKAMTAAGFKPRRATPGQAGGGMAGAPGMAPTPAEELLKKPPALD